MTAPLVALTHCCFETIETRDDDDEEMKCGEYLAFVLPATDALVSLTCLIVGILGALSMINMPAAASYALIGVSCGITALWIIMALSLKCCPKKCGLD